jgi:hypothetical protein
MRNALEDTFSSKTRTDSFTILNGIVTKKLSPNQRMVNRIERMDNIFHEHTNAQGAYVHDGKELTITGDAFKIGMLRATTSDVGEYDTVLEAIRGVSDEDGATNNRASQNRLPESY